MSRDDSHTSSPVIGSVDSNQAEQDAHLAQSMSTSLAAATARQQRSNTIDPSDHLADDLQIQDSSYFDQQQAASSSRSPRPSPRSPRQNNAPSSVARSLAAAANPSPASRFYRQHRNLSESSIASEGGAFIDHRRQQHFIHPSPATHSSSRRRNTTLHRQSTNDPASSDGEDNDAVGRNHSGVSSTGRTMRVGSLVDDGAMHVPEHAISDESPSVSPRLNRHLSHDSRHSRDSRRDNDQDDEEEEDQEIHPGEFSRRPSFTKAEEDVCFPALGPEPDLLDHMYHSEQAAPHHHLLHGYRFPFDFGALEEYAERERDSLPIPGVGPGKKGAGSGTSPPGYNGADASHRVNFGGPQSVSNTTEGGMRARIRQRKLSESVAPASARFKKLHLFEGGGGDERGSGAAASLAAVGAGSPGGGGGRPSYTTILDTKTPLLGGRGQSYGATSGIQAPGVAGGTASQSRPYRFSFYSNALPSTIHARSLAELPAEGQSFEDLFQGRMPTDDSDEMMMTNNNGMDEPQIQFSPPPRSNAGTIGGGGGGGGTGTQTPVGGRAASSKRSSINHGRAGPGGPGSTLGMSNGEAHGNKKSASRSDADLEANTWWLDVMCPTDQEMKVLSKVFGIHPLTTEDIQMEETREKIELFRNYYFVCFRSFEQDPYSPTYLEPLNMYIIVFREGTLSFHFRGTPHPQNVRRRIKQLKDYINVTSDWISYALIDDITDAFGPLIQNIEYEVDSIDELVLILKEAEQSDMLRRIGTCRKKVMGLLRLMGNKADVVKGLSKRCNENWSVAPKSDIGLYLSDIQDHITTSTQNLTHYEKILSRSHSNYLAQISIEMTDANNQINDVLSKLTALGTVLIPMNLVTGLWGMNVHVPGQDVENLHWFFGIIGCLAAIAVVGLYFTYKIFVRQ